MTAEDEEGGEGEIWDVLEAMGYNRRLELDQVRRDMHMYVHVCTHMYVYNYSNYLTCTCIHPSV